MSTATIDRNGTTHTEEAATAVLANVASEAERNKAEQEAREQQAEQEATRLLKLGMTSFKRGQQDEASHKLTAGNHYHAYVLNRISNKVKRDKAIMVIAAQLSPVTSESMTANDVNAMIRASAAHRLLYVETGIDATNVPYSMYTLVLASLVECHEQGKPTERYSLLSSLESECIELGKQIAEGNHTRKTAQDDARALNKEFATRQAIKAKATAEEAKAKRDAIEAQEQQARAKVEEAKAKVEEATRAADLAGEQAKAEAIALADKAKKDEENARFIAEDTARKATMAKQEARDAEKLATNAAIRQAKSEREPRPVKPEEKPSGPVSPRDYAERPVQDVAEHLAAILLAHKQPGAVAIKLLSILDAAPKGTFTASQLKRIRAFLDATKDA